MSTDWLASRIWSTPGLDILPSGRVEIIISTELLPIIVSRWAALISWTSQRCPYFSESMRNFSWSFSMTMSFVCGDFFSSKYLVTCHSHPPSSTIILASCMSAIETIFRTRNWEEPSPYPVSFQNCTVQNRRFIYSKKVSIVYRYFFKSKSFSYNKNYLIILRKSRISSISLSAMSSFLELDFSIAQRISSLIAWPRAERTADNCWIISRTPASSSIIWITPRSCPSIRRSLLLTRFFWSISLIFIVQVEWESKVSETKF